VVVVMPTWLGDVVMATPALARLRRAAPAARLVAMVPPAMVPVLAGLDDVDDGVGVDGKGATGPLRTAAAIRARRPEAVVLLPNSLRSGLAARLSGAPRRIGVPRDGRGPLLTDRVPAGPKGVPVPAVTAYVRIAAVATGAPIPEAADPGDRPRLALTDADRAAAAEALAAAPAAGRGDRLLVLVPGGNRDAKRWPPERFAHVARALREAPGLLPVVSGAPGERTLCAELAAAIGPPVVDLAAAGASLSAVKGVIARAALVVANDTGPRHLAAGLDVPCVALFGPTDPRWTTLPAAPESVLAAEPFLPPELVADRHPGLCRVDRIPASDVLHAARTRLAAAGGDAIDAVAAATRATAGPENRADLPARPHPPEDPT
jgi:heptosyltransferase-2